MNIVSFGGGTNSTAMIIGMYQHKIPIDLILFADTGGITFTVGGADITLTGLAIAALAGVVLNAVLPGNDYEFGTSAEGDKSADLGSY